MLSHSLFYCSLHTPVLPLMVRFSLSVSVELQMWEKLHLCAFMYMGGGKQSWDEKRDGCRRVCMLAFVYVCECVICMCVVSADMPVEHVYCEVLDLQTRRLFMFKSPHVIQRNHLKESKRQRVWQAPLCTLIPAWLTSYLLTTLGVRAELGSGGWVGWCGGLVIGSWWEAGEIVQNSAPTFPLVLNIASACLAQPIKNTENSAGRRRRVEGLGEGVSCLVCVSVGVWTDELASSLNCISRQETKLGWGYRPVNQVWGWFVVGNGFLRFILYLDLSIKSQCYFSSSCNMSAAMRTQVSNLFCLLFFENLSFWYNSKYSQP